MKTLTLALGITLASFTGTVFADMPMHEHHMDSHMMDMQAEPQTKHEGIGIIKAVNEKAHKVQIAHEPIPSLEWPAMTMWFELRDPLPQGIKAGDNVQFDLEQLHAKKWSITRIEKR